MIYTGQRGAVAPFVAILLFVIVVCVALVVDLGHVHSVKGQLQRAVDAAALAGAKHIPDEARVDAIAIAAAAANTVDGNSLVIEPDDVDLGNWDTEALGAGPASRWDSSATPINAVKVRAELDVDHVFFFFLDSTNVVADAIALARPNFLILPLAMISCVPTDATSQPLGTMPDMSICGVAGLGPNTGSDLSAWTSLVLTPNSEQTNEYILQQSDGVEIFNQIVFERGIKDTGSGGLENSPVINVSTAFDPNFTECINDQSLSSILAGGSISISCGLGGVKNKDVAPPGDFESLLTGIPDLQTATYNSSGNTYYNGIASFDPLVDYSQGINSLPRWYNISDNSGFDADDHIIRIATLDGILIQGPTETEAEYKQRLLDLKNGVMTSPYSALDGTVNRFETLIDGTQPSNVEADFLKTLAYAGYPRVNVTEGVGTVLGEFLARIYNVETKQDVDGPLPCDENEAEEDSPLGDDQLASVRLNVPVIFAGSCDKWKTNPSTNGYYIGMAKFLLTRSMLTNQMFACGSPTNASSSSTGCPGFEDPSLDSLGLFGLDPAEHFTSPAMIEGLFTIPTTDDDDDEGGLLDVFLVE